MTRQDSSHAEPQILDLIADLGSGNPLTRQRARLLLIHLGPESLPSLLEALKSKNIHTRWGAVHALAEFRSPENAPALVNMLFDADAGVRWAAMEGLIHLDRAGLKPLLERFIKDFDSTLLREGVHHILHVLKDRRELNAPELTLFFALDKHALPGFGSSRTDEAAWAAEKALEAIDQEKKQK
jgi:HEAT repeat protein